MLTKTLENLASIKEPACLTLSLNTHRTHPDNSVDTIALKNLCNEAQDRLISEFGKRDIKELLDKLESIPNEIDINYNLDSLHIFLSNNVKEIIRSTWPVDENAVHTGPSFFLRPLIKAVNRTEEYLILLLSQSGVQLFTAMNDAITGEIRNSDFPFKENRHFTTHGDTLSDPKLVDNLIREFLNRIDKAVVKVHHENEMKCIPVCTENNFSMLLQIADKPAIYYGCVPINYNDTANHKIAADCWEMIKDLQHKRRTSAIDEMKEAVGQGKVITDLREIFKAAKEGRGELLITHNNFRQPVAMTGDDNFDLVTDAAQTNVIDDIASEIAWEVISKKGRAIFTSQDEIKSLGDIALKVRY